MKKIFMASGADSDFVEENTMEANHSCGIVITADSLEEAQEIARNIKYTSHPNPELVEITLDKSGVILYAGGEC